MNKETEEHLTKLVAVKCKLMDGSDLTHEDRSMLLALVLPAIIDFERSKGHIWEGFTAPDFKCVVCGEML
jgi:hypothetical protein